MEKNTYPPARKRTPSQREGAGRGGGTAGFAGKAVSPLGRRRGRLTSYPERLETVSLIETAVHSGARQHRACEVAGITLRTLQPWCQGGVVNRDRRHDAIRPAPAYRLGAEERLRIIQVCSEPEYVDRPPCHIVPTLADRGIYIASESTYHRVLKAEQLVRHRGRAKRKVLTPDPQVIPLSSQTGCGHGISPTCLHK